MKKIRLKQGTLEWEKIKATRIGSSEVFDIIKYYASDEELQNCGINAETFKEETPYTSVWALYHKLLNDGIYRKEALSAEYAEYGHAVEPYGIYFLQQGRQKKLKPCEVFINNRLIASLDVAGVAEEIDIRPFDCGNGTPKVGQKFVCEQKSMFPLKLKSGIPFKYIIQAQYQILQTKADFFILQLMVLKEDNPFIRGKVCQMTNKKRFKYLDENMSVYNLYFKNNVHLLQLISVCLDRFFKDVDEQKEPKAFLEDDLQKNIIQSIRINTFYDDKKELTYDLSKLINLKKSLDMYDYEKQIEYQKIIDFAKENNACRFRDENKNTAFFSKAGSLLIKEDVL